MSNNEYNNSVTSPLTSQSGSLQAAGQLLASQREKLGLDIKECAETLKLTNGKLMALESGDASKFTSEVFIRGYLKNYAKLLHVSEEEIMHVYGAHDTSSKALSLDEQEQQRDRANRKWWLPYVIGIVIVLTWFVVSDYSNLIKPELDTSSNSLTSSLTEKKTVNNEDQLLGSSASTSSAHTDNITSNSVAGDVSNEKSLSSDSTTLPSITDHESVETSTTVKENVIDVNSHITDQALELNQHSPLSAQVSGTGTLVNENPSAVDSAGNQLPEQAAPIEAASQSSTEGVPVLGQSLVVINDTLRFEFSEDCWIEVIDSTGSKIISDLQFENTTLELSGTAPFQIILGNARGASLQFNAKSIALEEPNADGTLRLTVGS